MPTPKLDPRTTLFLLCDIQTKFRPAIYGYDQVVATANKLVKLAKILEIEVVASTQNAKALGPVDPAIDLPSLGPLLVATYDKTLFSMFTPDLKSILDARPAIKSIVLFGIEAHVCILQTTLSMLSLGAYTIHVIVDGISSCNGFEVPIAVERMRKEGAIVGTSESVAFQLMGDAGLPAFKTFSKFIKDEKESTKKVGEALLLGEVLPTQARESEVTSGGVVLKSAM